MKKVYKTIGVMSGTSLDGIDVAACEFKYKNDKWQYEFIDGKTYSYSDKLYNKLLHAQDLSGVDLVKLDVQYGKEIGKVVKVFINQTKYIPDFIASHGYTIFHKPEEGITFQIGSGAEIAVITGFKTICDFRSSDVALGGNGAPLVPIGDELLFGDYKACLNLGGFSNISYVKNKQRIAYDICPVNMLLNHITEKIGIRYDENGNFGRTGTIDTELLKNLNKLSFYKKAGPKSLGREFMDEHVFPLLKQKIKTKNQLRTSYEHMAKMIAKEINALADGKVLVTGGGAYNTFLMELLKKKSKLDLVVPDANLIEFKEAVLFAFLGVLRVTNTPNCLRSVTGALFDNIGGAIYCGVS